MGQFKKRLAAMQESYNGSREEAAGLPEGIYTMQLQGAKVMESNAGKLMVKREHLVIDGEHSGQVATDFLHYEGKLGPRFVIQFIQQMGYEAPENIEETEDIISQIAADAPTYTAQVKRSGDFTNINIKELVENAGDAGVGKQKPATAPDTKPAPAWKKGDKASFSDEEGNEFSGTITKLTGTTAIIDNADGEQFEVDLDALSPDGGGEVGEERPPRDESKQEADALPQDDDTDFAELVAFAQAHDMEVDEDVTKEDVVAALEETGWKLEELTEDEAALFNRVGITLNPVKPTAVKRMPPTPVPKGKAVVGKPKPEMKKAGKPAIKRKK